MLHPQLKVVLHPTLHFIPLGLLIILTAPLLFLLLLRYLIFVLFGGLYICH